MYSGFIGATPEDSTRIEEETGDRKEIAFAAEGWTFGIIFPFQRIGQEFNGDSSILITRGDLLMLPRLRPGVGMGLKVGRLFHLPGIYSDMTGDFTFAGVDHSYTWRGQSGTMRNHLCILRGVVCCSPQVDDPTILDN